MDYPKLDASRWRDPDDNIGIYLLTLGGLCFLVAVAFTTLVGVLYWFIGGF